MRNMVSVVCAALVALTCSTPVSLFADNVIELPVLAPSTPTTLVYLKFS